MSGEHLTNARPFSAASDMVPRRPVRLDTADNRQVVLSATNNVEPHGVIGPATALQGEAVTVYGRGAIVEAVAAASLGAGAQVGVASTNGALGPEAGASGTVRYRVGRSVEPAAAGDRFYVHVDPAQVSGTP